MGFTEWMIDEVLSAYEYLIKIDERFEASKHDPEIRRALRHHAMESAINGVYLKYFVPDDAESPVRKISETSLEAPSEDADCAGGDWHPDLDWPAFPWFSVDKLRPDGRTARLALAPAAGGPKLYVESPSDDDFKTRRTNFDLAETECIDFSDALSRAAGRLPNDATMLDRRQMAYFQRVEAQLKANEEIMLRLPLSPVMAEHIRATKEVLSSRPE